MSARAHAAARAHREQAERLPAAAQLVDHGDDHAGAGGRDRVAEAAAAAVDVDDRRVDAERADGRHRHRAERLVDLEQVDVVDGRARHARAPWGSRRRAHAGAARLDADRWPTTRSGPAAQAVRVGVVAAGEHDRGGGVVDARRVAGGDGRVLELGVERLELGERLDGHAARGCSSTANSRVTPSRSGYLDRHDLLLERARVDRRDGLPWTVAAHSSSRRG